MSKQTNRCGAITKKGLPCKNGQGCRIHQTRHGGALISMKTIKDLPRRISNVFKGPSNTEPKALREFLDSTGNQEITSIRLGRKPLKTTKLLNALTFGKLNKVMKDLNYDALYHNYLIIGLKDGSEHVIEKNHVIEQRKANSSDYKGADVVEIPVKRSVTLKDAIGNASIGDVDFWKYSALKNKNCQNFTHDMIIKNGMLPSDPTAVQAIALQDTKRIGDEMHPLLKDGIQAVTDLAGAASRLITGDGVMGRSKPGLGFNPVYLNYGGSLVFAVTPQKRHFFPKNPPGQKLKST